MISNDDLPPVPDSDDGQKHLFRQIENRIADLGVVQGNAAHSVDTLNTSLRRASTAGNAGGLLAALSILGSAIGGFDKSGPRELFVLVCVFSAGLVFSAVSMFMARHSELVVAKQLGALDILRAKAIAWETCRPESKRTELAQLLRDLNKIDVNQSVQWESKKAADFGWYATLASLVIVLAGWAAGLWLVSDFTEWTVWFNDSAPSSKP
jgi:hypothetical protein